MPEIQTPILLLLLLFFLSTTTATTASIPTGLDAFLSALSRDDPSANNDSYLLLPTPLKRSLTTTSAPLTPTHLISISIPIPITVHLVGPTTFSPASPSLLSSFISAAISSSDFLSISSPHFLTTSHSIQLSVSHPAKSSSLASQLSAALRSHLDSNPAPFHSSALTSVPYAVIDKFVQADYQQQVSTSTSPAYHIYLLSLEKQPRGYAYEYEGRGGASPSFTKCQGTIWASEDRYLWIDLGAGPVDYGPALSGEGLLPRGEFHPLATLHGRPKSEKALISDLASLVLSAYKALVVPSLRIPVYYENSLLIRFVHIHGEQKNPVGLDWGVIEKAIRDGDLGYQGQSLSFAKHSVKYSECPICSFAIARAMNSFSSRFLFENYTLIVSEYLDSKRIRQVLTDSSEEMHRFAGIGDEEYARAIPVFVFDLDYDKLLPLDRYHQAVAFKDMVVAVRTRSVQTVSDYSCNGRHVITQTLNLERPIIGSVLQSMWGVAPTHLSWSPEHNSTLVDYTWSTGQTPFGPFSEIKSLSFAQRDAAKRNVLVTTLNYTVTSAIDVLESMAAHGGEKMLLKKKRHVEFVQRWNLLNYKLEKLVSAMSRLDFERAMFFLKSSDHDLYALHTLLYQASEELEASLVCFKDPPFPWVSVSMSGVFIFGFFYVYSKRDKLFRSKRKQF